MKTVSLACNECGAPISVPGSTNHLSCSHCGAQLSVRHEGGASFTVAMEEINDRTARMEEELAQLRRDSEIAKIDRQWQIDREKYVILGKNGQRSWPSTGGAIVGGVISVVAGVFISGTMFSNGAGELAFGGVAVAVVGVLFALKRHSDAVRYRKAKNRYHRRRAEASQA